jgi:hypothetical protein
MVLDVTRKTSVPVLVRWLLGLGAGLKQDRMPYLTA